MGELESVSLPTSLRSGYEKAAYYIVPAVESGIPLEFHSSIRG
jgi:hypothetical protein